MYVIFIIFIYLSVRSLFFFVKNLKRYLELPESEKAYFKHHVKVPLIAFSIWALFTIIFFIKFIYWFFNFFKYFRIVYYRVLFK